EISYARQGNQRAVDQGVDMRANQYVMSQVTVDDGRSNRYSDVIDYTVLGPGNTSSTNVGSGFYDQNERENYGYSHVTTTHGIKQSDGSFLQGDGWRVERFYENQDFSRKGFLAAEYEETATGAIIRGSRLTYADPTTLGLPPRTPTFFPALTQKQTL